MLQVEVFKTNVQKEEEADRLSLAICNHFPALAIHFDLEDCDRILRIEGVLIYHEQVTDLLSELGYTCDVLE
ncbi:MAG: hypothetical protein JWO58_1237 [Chitinophagaceae bacterium]|nr:hypothetical protein [Chitinophagaceae bacterium]